MSVPTIFALPGNDDLAAAVAAKAQLPVGRLEARRFPDGESYIRYREEIAGKQIVIVCTLDHPDDKLLSLVFAAETARELGARDIGLVVPYLAYMRQDRRFQAGEAITSATFAQLLSRSFDWLITIDPHLHRRASLGEIYSAPSLVMHAAPMISQWISNEIKLPLIVGPDNESEQWVSAVAKDADCPYTVLTKTRHGDRDVEVTIPNVDRWRSHTPVLLDDIVSTARTMIETVKHLAAAQLAPPVCIGVHGIFADNAYQELKASGVPRVVTCNTIPHESNEIDISGLLVDGLRRLLK